MRPTRRFFLWLAALAGLGALYRVYDGWVVEYLLLAAAVFPLLVTALSLPGLLLARAELTEGPPLVRGGAGETLLLLRAPGLLPLTMRVRVRMVNLRTGAAQTVRREARGRGPSRCPVPLDAERCGVLRCTVERARCTDPLGLCSVRVRKGADVLRLVLPRPAAPVVEPDWTQAGASDRLRPKYGGGFAEDHDLRAYRPGDPLGSIHWKASAKLDQPVVREPLVPDRAVRLVTFSPEADQLDRTLDTLYWLSLQLCQRGEAHFLAWRCGTRELRAEVAEPADVEAAFFQLLSTRPDGVPEVSGATLLCRFHVEKGEVTVL